MRKNRYTLWLTLGILAGLLWMGCQNRLPVSPESDAGSPLSKASVRNGDNIVPDQYIVVLKGPASPAAVARSAGAKLLHSYRTALHGFSAVAPNAQVLSALRKNPNVDYVEPDLVLQAVAQTLPTGVDRIDADRNSTANIDGSDDRVDVDVAILDSGIDPNHPDLNVVGGTHFYTVTIGPPGQRGSYQDRNYADDNGHGSHVAGTVGALDNGIGVVGVAPGVRLWAVKVLDSSGSGYLSDIIAGIDWVADRAATIEVANMSLGGSGQSSAFRTAIQNSVAAGVFYAVAAGNDGQDVYGADGKFGTSDDFIPAAYPEAAAISALADADGQPGGTGGSTSYGGDDSFASFSNYSVSVVSGNPVNSPGKAIDLILPGVDILSTYMNGGYATASGTSMASPHAAGLAALYIATHSRATSASEVYSIRQALIDEGAAQTGSVGLATLNDPDGNEENLGWAGTPPSTTPVTDIAVSSVSAPAGVTAGDVVQVDVTIRNAGNQDVTSDIGVSLNDDTDGVLVGSQTISGGLTAGASVTLTFSWDTGSASTGDHTLTATQNFSDDNSANDSKSTVVTVSQPSAGVTVSDIDPNSVTAGGTVGVTITGSGFVSGASVSFENGTGPAPSVSDVKVGDNSATITATVSTKSGGPPGNRVWDVRVTNPDGSSGVLSGGFTVSK